MIPAVPYLQALGLERNQLIQRWDCMLFGQWLRQRISAVLFKRMFFIGMALLGLHLLIAG